MLGLLSSYFILHQEDVYWVISNVTLAYLLDNLHLQMCVCVCLCVCLCEIMCRSIV